METVYNEKIVVSVQDQSESAMRTVQRRVDETESRMRRLAATPFRMVVTAVDKTRETISSIMKMAAATVNPITIPVRMGKLIGGAVGGAAGALGAVGLAQMGIQGIAGAAQGLGDVLGFGLASQMEQTQAQFMAFTKDAGKTAEILDLIKTRAALTPFSFQDMSTAAAAMLPIVKSTGIGLEDLMKQAEVLAASNPMQGMEGASFSLREALTGDFTSITDRFNLSRSSINKWKAEGVSNFEIVQRAMKEMGFDSSLVANMGKTLTGRWSTFLDTIADLKRAFIAPIFERVSASLITLQGVLDTNMDTFKEWGSNAGKWIGDAADKIGESVGHIKTIFDGLVAAFTVDKGGMGIVIQQIRELFGNDFADAIEPAVQTFMEFIPTIQDFWSAVTGSGDEAQAAFDRLPQPLQTVEKIIYGIQSAFSDLMAGNTTGFIANIVGALSDLTGVDIQGFFDSLLPTWGRVNTVVTGFMEALGKIVPQPIKDFVQSLFDTGTAMASTADPLNGLTEGINSLSGFLATAWHWLEQHKEVQSVLVGVIGAATAGFVAYQVALAAVAVWTAIVEGATGAYTAVQWLLNAALTANPIGIVIVALAGLAAGLIYAYNTSEDFRNVVDPILHGLGDAINWLWHNVIEPAFPAIVRLWEDLKNDTVRTLATLPIRMWEIGAEIMNNLIKGLGGPDVLGWIRTNITDKIPDFIKSALGIHSPSSVMTDIGSNMMLGLLHGIQQHFPDLQSIMDSISGAVSGAFGAGNTTSWLVQAMALTGVGADWLQGLLALVSRESTGNPGAVNPVAVGSEHAAGLLQTLPSTFAANAMPGHGDIFNPVDNAAAAINYIKRTYGHVNNTPLFTNPSGYVGYDAGGILPPGATMAMNATGQNEYVLTRGQLSGFGGLTVHAPLNIDARGASAGVSDELERRLPDIADTLFHILADDLGVVLSNMQASAPA